ncbi:MAG TPA: cytochrome c peroxidase [Candidatus Solibacter sp.]|nr:cytochrome c peroxidase [Candidatus Solibacter sp.]
MRRFTLCLSLVFAAGAVAIASGHFGKVNGASENRSSEKDNFSSDGFSRQEWAVIKTLSPLPALPVDTTNKYRDSPAAALLGQKLFFEPRLSGPIQTGTAQQGQLGAIGEAGKIACRNCHMPESKWLYDIRSNNGGAIPNATALGSQWMTRNVSSVVNTVFYVHPGSSAHWRENDGFSDSEWFDAQSEPEGPPVQNGSRLQLAHVIFEHYRADYNDAFPDFSLDPGLADLKRFPATGSPYTDTSNWNSLSKADKEIINRILVNYGKAIEAYLRKLVSRDAPFDRFVAGDHRAISHEAKQGLKLFIGKAGCIHCHNTPLFSDDDFHVIGLRIDTSLSPHADPTETGRAANQALICGTTVADGDFNVNGHFSDDPATTRNGNFCSQTISPGMWRTKGLRQVAETAPYFRDGQAATLDDVINFYDRGGDPEGTFLGGPKQIRPLHLSAEEKAQLKEFLKTLTGEPVPAQFLRDLHN